MSLIENLHSAILARITDNIAGIQTSGFYPKLRTAVITPAVFVDMVSLEPGDDPGTEQLAVVARFQARAIVTAGENSLIQVRELAAEIARVLLASRIFLSNSQTVNIRQPMPNFHAMKIKRKFRYSSVFTGNCWVICCLLWFLSAIKARWKLAWKLTKKQINSLLTCH